MPRRHAWLNKSRMAWGSFSRYRLSQMIPRMSWDKRNLFNIWERSTVYVPETMRDDRKKITLQRLLARRLVCGYHCEPFTFRQMKKSVMTHQNPYYRVRAFDVSHDRTRPITSLPPAQRSGRLPEVPIHSLIFSELERRLDYAVFRACFAPSLWDARLLIHHGKVRVEGTICRRPELLLEPGMMFSTEPRHLRKIGVHLPPMPKPSSPISASPALDAELATLAAPTPEAPASETSAEAPAETDEAAAAEAEKQKRAERKAAEKEARAVVRKQQAERELETWQRGELDYTVPEYAAAMMFIPAYLEVNFRACAAVYVRHPTAKPATATRPGVSEIPSPWDSANGDLFRLNQEFWSLHKTKNRKRATEGVIRFKPGKVFQRDNNRMRYIGQGGAELIQHLGALRRGTARQDEAYIAGHETEDDRAAATERVREIRDARRQMYTKSRLTAEAVPSEVAAKNAPSRARSGILQRRREEADEGQRRHLDSMPNMYARRSRQPKPPSE